MGMTIDKTIEFYNGLECYTPQAKDARDVAIDTMRKYKKIQEIMEHWVGTQCVEVDLQTLFKIREVLEDGNDD